jgi:hypothetical protein
MEAKAIFFGKERYHLPIRSTEIAAYKAFHKGFGIGLFANQGMIFMRIPMYLISHKSFLLQDANDSRNGVIGFPR